jgi:hypothetical protein
MVNRMILAKLIDTYCLYTLVPESPRSREMKFIPSFVPSSPRKRFRAASPFLLKTASW